MINGQGTGGGLTTARVRDLLLGRINTWPSGDSVVIVLCVDPAGERAVERICSRSVGLLQRGWKRLVFSGTGAMPLITDTWQGAVALVERTPGAITVLADVPSPSVSVGTAQVVPLESLTAVTAP